MKVVQDPSVAWVADAWCAEADVRPGDLAFGFLRVPLDYAVSYRPGTRFGPAAILAELGEWSLFCTDKRVSLDGVRLVDLGEVDVVHSLETTYGRIRSAVASIGPGLTPVVLGGDHSISDPVVRGLADRLGSAPAVVVFDAHFDSRDPVPGKEHSGHWMRTLGDVVDYSLVAQVGISSYLYSDAYLADAEAKGVLVRTPYEIRRAGWLALVDEVCAHASAAPAVYVSVDIDCLDQSAAPGTSAVNPIGLLPYEVVDAVFELASRLPVVGLDVVEVSPPLDPSGATARVAAAIVLNFMAGTVVRSRAGCGAFGGAGVTKPHVVFVEMSGTGAGEQCLLYSTERGYRTTLLTRSPDRDDLPDVAVDVVGCETNDVAVVVQCVTDLDARHPVGGVTTTHDLYTPQAAAAAEALGLPGIRYDAVVGVRDKHRMRVRLAERCPHLNPPFRHVRSLDEALAVADEWGFPFVAKPLDANDSWGVELVDSRDDLVAYMDATERWELDPEQELASGVLLEGLLEGSEHTIDTIQHKGGPLQLMCATGKEMPPGRFFAEANCFLPVDAELTELLFREVATALEALEIDCGAVHSECRVHDGEVKILEVNPRLGGDMLGSHMIEAAYGASPIEQVVEIALGRGVPWEPTRAQGAALYGITVPSSGIFGGVRNLDEILRQEGVIGARVYASPGAECSFPPRSNGDFVGRVVALGPTAEVALERARRAAGAADVVMRDAVTA